MTSLPTVVYMESEAVVLLLCNEPYLLECTEKVLTPNGFRVLTAETGDEAVKIYQEHQEEIDLVLLKLSPDGPTTFEALRAINPAVRCAFMSGHAYDWESELMSRGAIGCIQTPRRAEEFVRSMRELSLR